MPTFCDIGWLVSLGRVDNIVQLNQQLAVESRNSMSPLGLGDGMQDIRPREEPRGRSGELPRVLLRLALAGGLIAATLTVQGCSSTITTPLPDPHSTVTSSISTQDRQKEMDALKSKAATHEQDAERQIENSQ